MSKDFIFINSTVCYYVRWYYDSQYRRVKVYESVKNDLK